MADYRKELLPDYDMESAISKKNEQMVKEYTNKKSKLLIELYRTNRYKALEELLEKELLVNTYCFEKVQMKFPIQFGVGFFAGVLKMIKVIVKENYKQLNVQNCLNHMEWENIPHVAQILETISKRPRIQHANLAETIGISTGTLSGLMKRLVDAGLVTFIRSGKFKYYILTSVGEKYYRQNQQILEQNIILSKSLPEARFLLNPDIHSLMMQRNQTTWSNTLAANKNSKVFSDDNIESPETNIAYSSKLVANL